MQRILLALIYSAFTFLIPLSVSFIYLNIHRALGKALSHALPVISVSDVFSVFFTRIPLGALITDHYEAGHP